MTMDKINAAYNDIKNKISEKPRVGLILGSGLGDFANQFTDSTYIRYDEISNFPVSTVSGHEGRFVFGKLNGVPVCAMQGRVHYYEGYSMDEVVMPVRIMALLGIETLILTNACGGINEDFVPGDLMLISDHISSFVPSPLIGKNLDEFGTRFPDMSEVYDSSLRQKVKEVADNIRIGLREGVYLQTTGPNYETPAEIRMYRALGADAVGMSTTCEAMVARHCGIRVAGISCITNMASGMSDKKLDHGEVKETADMVSAKFSALVKGVISVL